MSRHDQRLSRDELRIIAKQLRRAAQVIDGAPECDHVPQCKVGAEHALIVSRGWQVPLSAASEGPGPKGAHSDPTLAAVLRGPDPLALVHAALIEQLKDTYRMAVDLTRQLLDVNGTALVAASRAGVGHCDDCGRYCDASSDTTRLRAGLCNACRQAVRNRAAAS